MSDEEEIWDTTDLQLRSEDTGWPPFEELAPRINAVPVLNRRPGELIGLPHCTCNGFDWTFIIQDYTDSQVAENITYDLLEDWQVTPEDLMEASKHNAWEERDLAAYTIHFCKTTSIAIPYLKLHFRSHFYAAPYGSSLILVPEVINEIFYLIGNFVSCIPGLDMVYIIPSAFLKKNRIDPSQALKVVMKDDKEGPFFSEGQMLFPRNDFFDEPDYDYNEI